MIYIMNNIQKRFLLFLIGCIGTRLVLVKITKDINPIWLPYFGVVALCIAIGFMYIFLTGSRKTGGEIFGDKIWWNDLRPIHSILYFLFAYNAIQQTKQAWIFLAIDVCIGFVSFMYFDIQNKDYLLLLE